MTMRITIAVVLALGLGGGAAALAQTVSDPEVTLPSGQTVNEDLADGFPKEGEPFMVAGPDGNPLVCPGESEPVTITDTDLPPGIGKAHQIAAPKGVTSWVSDQDGIVRCDDRGRPIWVPDTAANVASKVAPVALQKPVNLAK
jgi:hypothetical protein